MGGGARRPVPAAGGGPRLLLPAGGGPRLVFTRAEEEKQEELSCAMVWFGRELARRGVIA